MHRLGTGLEGIVRSRHGDTLLPDGLHLLGPRIDDGDVVAGAREKRTEVTSDCSGADEEQLLDHVFLLCGRSPTRDVCPNDASGQRVVYARRRPKLAREAYSLCVERASEGANEADGPFSAAY